ncbi:GNAT family N-acetyltransferase [Kaistia sp. UC242_56]|uniref:GNAT family N-acetyltransferase n=1 Tax=Kaistia sp. UC242_56 TaxID=3374625 RepID=UPI0037A714FF
MVADYDRAVKEHINLLYSGQRLVGLMETVQHPDHLWIENIAVAPDPQGNGFGKQLLALAEGIAAGVECKEIRLLTNEAFSSNIDLCRRTGFSVDRERAISFRGHHRLHEQKTV